MNITKEVERTVARLSEGTIFKYEDLPLYGEKPGAVVKAVCRLTGDGKIVRFGRGQYYKPRQTVFGATRPRESDFIKSYLFSGNKQVGYITGLSLYNKWGLTTQVPRVVEIATTAKRNAPRVGGLNIRLVKSRHANISRDNAGCLQFLDVLKNIKKIPDAEPGELLAGLKKRLVRFDDRALRQLERIAVESYNAGTRALLGALLESCRGYSNQTLKNSINPLSRYSVGTILAYLPNAGRWFLR